MYIVMHTVINTPLSTAARNPLNYYYLSRLKRKTVVPACSIGTYISVHTPLAATIIIIYIYIYWFGESVCVCVCARERERERGCPVY